MRNPESFRTLELTAVILTALGKFIFMDYLDLRFAYITAVVLLWLAYILYRRNSHKDILRYWGFRTDNFMKVLRMVLIPGLIVSIAFVLIGYFQGTLLVTWHIIPILLLYPVWGTLQQFLLIALTAGNLRDSNKIHLPKAVIVLVSSLLFSAIHYPFGWLMLATFVMAVFYSLLYLKERNLFVLGIFHGGLGALFFYTVMTRDPYVEIFGKIFHSSS